MSIKAAITESEKCIHKSPITHPNMRLASFFAIVLFGLLPGVSAAAVDTQDRDLHQSPTVTGDAAEIVWPSSVSLNSARRGGVASNAELMRS